MEPTPKKRTRKSGNDRRRSHRQAIAWKGGVKRSHYREPYSLSLLAKWWFGTSTWVVIT